MSTQQSTHTILGVPLHDISMQNILDTIKKGLSSPPRFFHIVSVNPETLVIAQNDSELMRIYKKADLALCDGIGIQFASQLLGSKLKDRIPGSVLLPHLLNLAGQISSTVVLIGSQANLADGIAKCYSRSYPKANFVGTYGYQNISNPTIQEEQALESIVRSTRPRLVFVAFGTPYQERWIYEHKDLLKGAICMGVGGAFDYISGATRRPHPIIRRLGLEWAYRLITQPWRAKRQLIRLPLFVYLVLKEKIRSIMLRKNEQKS